jgi:phosphatidylserine/phosphatidylglycerophosphate/cardiolipin synthase-like enzyme
MKRSVLLIILALVVLPACQPAQQTPTTAPPSPTPAAVVTTSPADEAPVEIPLSVGHGVDGGWYQLYFTDPANPNADQLTGGVDGPLVEAIDGAQLSVDAAMYSLGIFAVRQALIHAHRRGVTVRVVMESDNMDRKDVQALQEGGVEIVGDRRQGLMHNKFMVIDRREVWTGSMNFTDDGAYNDRNNLLRIESVPVAQDYESEFNEMFVDDKFGPDLGTATPNPRLAIHGTPVAVFFSPDDHVEKFLVDLLKGAKKSINFLAYSFTSDPLADVIRERAAAGVTVAGVMDEDQAKTNKGAEYDAFRTAGLNVRLDGEQGLMHNKVIVIDGETVVTGSYNLTASADKSNDENVIVLINTDIAAQYLQEFKRIQAAAKP